jgi:colicin import membrane protein
MWETIRENPRPVMYAVLMHLMLLALLVFSLDWTPKISHPPGMKVPIQAELVDQRQLDAVTEKKQAEQRKIEEAKRQAALAEKRKVEEQRQAEAEAKQKAEQAAKQKADAEAKRKAEAEQKRKADEAQRREAEQALQSQLAAEQERMEAGRVQGVVAEYIAYIQERIQRSWLRPPGSVAGLSCVVQVGLIPGGEVARVTIVRSSGDPIFDRSVETAVYKASPLPLPPDAALFKHFRDLRLIFKPN